MRKRTSELLFALSRNIKPLIDRLFILSLLMVFGQSFVVGQTPVEQTVLNTLNHKKNVVYKTVDGADIKLDIFYPDADKMQAENPWMLHVHGGGWAGGSKYNILKKPYMRTLQSLLDSGIVCVTIDYRLARGTSTAYDAVVDAKDAARFLLKNAKQYKLDHKNYGVWGGSAGGHLSLLTALGANADFQGDAKLADFSPQFKCVASYFPFTSCVNSELTPGSIFADGKLFTRLLGAPLNEKPELAKLLSPAELLDANSPSILLLHGKKDPVLPIINSTYMMQVAKQKNADVQLLSVENAGHSFQGANISPSMDAINDYSTQFILSHLKAKKYQRSDGSPFVSKAILPKFSWNTTPMYYHFGDIDRVLEPEEVEFIAARTGFITLEKSHGFHLLGDAVLGTKHEVAAFHKVNPDIKVLYYFNSFVAWPFTRFNKNLTPEAIAGNPDFAKFLVNNYKTGELMQKTNGPAPTYYFDYLNPEFRKWWVDAAVEGVNITGADGIFIDRMNKDGQSGYAPERNDEIQKAKREMMSALKEKLGPNKILLGNNAADNPNVFPYCDAFMFEHYNKTVTSKENLLREWQDMVQVTKAGKISIYRFGAKGKGRTDITIGETNTDGMLERSKEQLEYFHACYLIGAQPYSYFQYNWGWNLSDGNLVDYPELQKPLGAPKDAYKRVTPEGWQFTRDFEHASVWVDTEKGEAKITWK